MTSTQSDLKDSPHFQEGLFKSDEDPAQPLVEASLSGNNSALQTLLSQSQWTKIMLEEQHVVYDPLKPLEVPRVLTTPMSNLERAFEVASLQGHADVVSTLLAFAQQNGIYHASWARFRAEEIMRRGHYAVIRTIASADPDFINLRVGMGFPPLYEAVRLGQTAVVAVLLDSGADPLCLPKKLMWYAAMGRGPQMTELLLERGVPIAGTGALHSAASAGELDTMRLLIQHSDTAALNETLPNFLDRTPMHFAALRGKVDAMKLLEQSGARSDLVDQEGKTATELLKLTQAGGRIT